MYQIEEVIAKLHALIENGQPCATVTVVKTSGSIPVEIGAKMLVGPGGVLLAGTIGGGKLEMLAIEEAGRQIESGAGGLFSYVLTEEEAGGLGMVCGGNLQAFIEVFTPQDQLVLVGGGHVNLALAKLSALFGFRLFVIDERPEWANEENFPGATVLNTSAEEGFRQIPMNTSTVVVIATRGHRADLEGLEAALDHPARYIGMIGSKRKVLEVYKELEEKRDLSSERARIFAPVGLDLGGKSPMSVALSIMAEIQMVKNGKSGRSMREGLPR
ncbi:MAG: XdhC family protein [Bacteroidota bacterium]